MSTYKQGQEWQRDKNTIVWLRARIEELETGNEELHQEIREMQEVADHEETPQVLDSFEYTETDSMHNPGHDPSGNEY